jgi:uncharacterized protein YjiS (DUF1127 family)
MSTHKFTIDQPTFAPVFVRDAVGAVTRALAPASAVVAAMSRWRKRRLAAAELRALDDRLLQDIGLTRGQIDATLAGDAAEFDPELR